MAAYVTKVGVPGPAQALDRPGCLCFRSVAATGYVVDSPPNSS